MLDFLQPLQLPVIPENLNAIGGQPVGMDKNDPLLAWLSAEILATKNFRDAVCFHARRLLAKQTAPFAVAIVEGVAKAGGKGVIPSLKNVFLGRLL